MRTQHIYVQYALYGIACAVLLAFVVLCVATNNIITASLAVFTIILVCICVLGSMVFGGWQLGNMESICLTILAGFCVDYIVHLAHSYMESPDRSTREARVRYSVGHMGVSVLSGALTSLGASLLLFFCTLQFFSTFGTFFFGTIFLAWVWANFFFIPALGTFGPEGIQGDFYGNMFGPKAGDSAGDKESTEDNPAAATADSDGVEVAQD
jgi:predicted RND superfamily exporter protein